MVGYDEFLFGGGDHAFFDGAVVEVWVGIAEVDVDSGGSEEAFVYADIFEQGIGEGAEGAVHVAPYLTSDVEEVHVAAGL